MRIGKVEPEGWPVRSGPSCREVQIRGLPEGSTFPILSMTPWLIIFLAYQLYFDYCPPPFAKAGYIKTHLSICLSVRLSVTKTLTWLISSEVFMIEHWYLACMILVTSPFYWYHAATLTFDLLQEQDKSSDIEQQPPFGVKSNLLPGRQAGDHYSSNLLVWGRYSIFSTQLREWCYVAMQRCYVTSLNRKSSMHRCKKIRFCMHWQI